MTFVFADAGYWVALFDPNDGLHAIAREVASGLGQCRIVTSQLVLTEFLNAFASKGERIRTAAIKFVRAILNDPNVEVVPQTALLFARALDFYQERLDKDWGLIDCASILIMGDRNIREALAHDACFQQAGFQSLLRRPAKTA
jgi:uncharacterized protein